MNRTWASLVESGKHVLPSLHHYCLPLSLHSLLHERQIYSLFVLTSKWELQKIALHTQHHTFVTTTTFEMRFYRVQNLKEQKNKIRENYRRGLQTSSTTIIWSRVSRKEKKNERSSEEEKKNGESNFLHVRARADVQASQQATFLNHGRKPELIIRHARIVTYPGF